MANRKESNEPTDMGGEDKHRHDVGDREAQLHAAARRTTSATRSPASTRSSSPRRPRRWSASSDSWPITCRMDPRSDLGAGSRGPLPTGAPVRWLCSPTNIGVKRPCC